MAKKKELKIYVGGSFVDLHTISKDELKERIESDSRTSRDFITNKDNKIGKLQNEVHYLKELMKDLFVQKQYRSDIDPTDLFKNN